LRIPTAKLRDWFRVKRTTFENWRIDRPPLEYQALCYGKSKIC
jgi:hypothetical protein